jgi:aromatic-L-amino-acid decarboxylase
MHHEEFRRHGHAFVDWMADYMGGVEQYPVRAQVRPGDIAARLPDAAPETGEDMDRIFADFADIVMPGMTHWQHPSFFAYFPANSSPPSVLAEMLTATLGAQCMLWQTSPAATEMETRVLDWLRRMIGLPDGFDGVIQDSASSATLCALLTAREQATDGAANENGLAGGPKMAVYVSEETHSSVEKDARVAGFGRRALRKIATDDDLAMDAAALEKAIAEDLAAGIKPACVVATLGTTGTGAVDPLADIGAVCNRYDVWLHVDAAWAGSALILPEHRWMIDGIDHVDSFVFSPHKWLLTNFDCSAYFVRDPAALVGTLSILPEYLKTASAHDITNYMDWSVPLGRRFRALKLWFVIRSYGVEGLRRILAGHIECAERLEKEIEASPDFELVTPRSLALLTFRYRPDGAPDLDALNQALLEKINDEGKLYLTQTRVRDAYVIRFSIGQTQTEWRHVEAGWRAIQETAHALS